MRPLPIGFSLVLGLVTACSSSTKSDVNGAGDAASTTQADAAADGAEVGVSATSSATPPQSSTGSASHSPTSPAQGNSSAAQSSGAPNTPDASDEPAPSEDAGATPTSPTLSAAPSAEPALTMSAQPSQAATTAAPSTTPLTIVVLGSSSTAGKNLDEPMYGGDPANKSWVTLYREYLSMLRPGSQVIDLAVPGYSSFNGLPTGTVNSSEYPAVDPEYNITAALALNPDAVIVSYHLGNGAPTSQIIDNLLTIQSTAAAVGVPIWVGTPHPRAEDTELASILELTDAILAEFGDYALDFFSVRADASGLALPDLILSDGNHPNQAGHEVLFQVVVDADIPSVLDQ